jgi:uncharacterized protein
LQSKTGEKKMRENLLKKLAYWHANFPWRMLIIVIILTLIFAGLSSQLTVTMRWSDLLPSNDKRTIQFNKIIDEFVTSTSIIIVVQGEEKQMKRFADDLAPRLLTAVDTLKNAGLQKKIDKITPKIAELDSLAVDKNEIEKLKFNVLELESQKNKKLIQRVDYKTEIDFLRNHGLMLIKEKDLKNIKEIYTDPNLAGLLFNINNSMEKEYIGDSESISTREKEDQAVMFLDGIQNLIGLMRKFVQNEQILENETIDAVDKLLLGEPYILSYDKQALVINAIPNFTMMNTELMVNGTEVIQSLVDDLLQEYPGLIAGLTGFIPIGHDEMVYSAQSLSDTTIIALIAILILLIISLRMWVAPVFAILNLIIGIVWAIGLTALLIGQLNIMTQMMAVILLGLGIDFSIHIISGFTEWRASGDSIAIAMEKTFLKSGKGVVTGALTTAFAFLTLIISSSRGMKEMGMATGFGLLAILFTTMLLLPIMLVFRERRIEKKRKQGKIKKQFVQRDISFKFLGSASVWFGKNYTFTILMAIIITILLGWSASKITFDTNYMNIEPEGLTSITLQDTVMDKFDLSMDYAMILADDVNQSRALAKKCRDLGSVAITDDISLYLPSENEQQRRTPHIREIAQIIKSARIKKGIRTNEIEKLKNELDRLQMNIIEMQDMAFLGGQDKVDNKCKSIVGDPENPNSENQVLSLLTLIEGNEKKSLINLSKLQNEFAPYFKESVTRMCSTKPIKLEELPVTILDRYSNKGRNQFLVTAFPGGAIWTDSEFLQRFANDLEGVSDRATGMPPVFRALIEIIGKDGRNAVLLTLLIVFLLLWFDFRNVVHALMAMIPLAVGIFWMVGLMKITGQQLTVMNIMGLPMIVGIGIDDGVHIMHRWIHEGKGKIHTIFSSTGKAILLTSLTTMLAFGSLIFSIWRGFGHLGAALFVGVGACFLTSVIILPGIIGLIEKRKEK